MIRAPRRQPACDPRETTASEAWEYEVNRSWPPGERFRFWNDQRVPEHLRQHAEPDPRALLIDDSRGDEYHRALAKWNQRRMDWLRDQING